MSAGIEDVEFPFLAPPAEAEAVAPLERPPTFSIVITAYEAAETIAAAVASALDQTHPAEEVVVVDDGSSDDIAGALAPFRDRIEVVSKPNGGGASARNAGAAAASAEFMAVLDADDRYHPRRLESIAAVATGRPDLDLITTDAQLIVDGEPRGRFASDTPFAAQNQREEIFRACFVGGWPAVRIARLGEIGGFDEGMRIAYDWDCWLRLILSGSAAGFVDEPFYDYVLHQGSLAASRVPSLWERVLLLEKAEAEPGLSAGERDLLKKMLSWRRSEAVREEAHAIATGSGDRSRSLSLARLPGIDRRARLAAALSGWAPPLARRLTGGRQAPADRV